MSNATIGGCSCGSDEKNEEREKRAGYLGSAVAEWEEVRRKAKEDDE